MTILKLFHVQLLILLLVTVLTGEADFAVMAIENARSGSILHNYTLIRESGMKMLGEHNLQDNTESDGITGSDILLIYRRFAPILLLLLNAWTFLNQYPDMTLIESDDTAGSAKQVSENKLKGIAAIASSEAARIYGLDIIAPGIETYKQNYTRFLVVGP